MTKQFRKWGRWIAAYRWGRLNITGKLFYSLIVFSLLITIEFVGLSFAITNLSAVRSFVEGANRWAKAQKNAVISLHSYIMTRDENFYYQIREDLSVIEGSRRCRLEIARRDTNPEVLMDALIQARVPEHEMEGMVFFLKHFSFFSPVQRSVVLWEEGDRQIKVFQDFAGSVHQKIRDGDFDEEAQKAAALELHRLNARQTDLEGSFSSSLNEGAEMMETALLWVIFCFACLLIVTAFVMVRQFSRYFSSHMKVLSDTAERIGRGDFEQRVKFKLNDEIGDLATSINRMAEQLKNNVGRRQEAEHLSEVKTRFLANMSHEIRTPLGSMMGFARLLENDGLKHAERMKYLSIIQKAGENLSGVINDILDISKIESGHIAVDTGDVALPEILDDLQRLLEQRCHEKGIELILYKDRNMPDRVHTDPLRLRQILLNVLGNAIKFTERGRISLEARHLDEHLIFDIRDTGIGITEEARHLIFEPFEQADTSHTRRYGGTGLGIPLSKHFAELLGGDLILVSSQKGIGSHFQVKLKYVPAKEPAIGITPDPASEASTRIAGMKILAVDDAEDNRYLLELLLKARGCTVDMAENGKEAITKALIGDYDVILMDLQMPIMGGMEAVRILRNQGMSTPIVALTARAMTEDSEECMASGFSDFLSKPIRMERLLAVLENFSPKGGAQELKKSSYFHLHMI